MSTTALCIAREFALTSIRRSSGTVSRGLRSACGQFVGEFRAAFVRGFSMTCVGMAVVLGFSVWSSSAVARQAQPAGTPEVIITALTEQAQATLGREQQVRVRAREPLTADSPVPFMLTGAEGAAKQATLLLSGVGVAITVDSTSIEMQLRRDCAVGVRAFTDGGNGGWVDVYSSNNGAVLLTFPGGNVVMKAGGVRLDRTERGVRVMVSGGQALVFGGALPAEGVSELKNGTVLGGDQANAVLVGPGGTLSAPEAAADAGATMRRATSLVVQQSMLPDLVRLAESVAEGDIEPPTRGTRVPVVSVAPEVRIPEIVPRGGVAGQLLAGTQAVVSGSVRTTAETFFASGNAALAIVGARLERTRIVGTPTGIGAPLSISGQLTRPFTIGR